MTTLSSTVASPTPDTSDDAMHHVHRAIGRAAKELTRTSDIDHLRTVAEGVQKVATALTGLVDALAERSPAAVARAGHADIVEELVRDLRAARGCLTTAGLLLAPAVSDLREIANGRVPPKDKKRRRLYEDVTTPKPTAATVIDGKTVPREITAAPEAAKAS